MNKLYFAFPSLPEKLYAMQPTIKAVIWAVGFAVVFGFVLWRIWKSEGK